jgi:cytidylate kinase
VPEGRAAVGGAEAQAAVDGAADAEALAAAGSAADAEAQAAVGGAADAEALAAAAAGDAEARAAVDGAADAEALAAAAAGDAEARAAVDGAADAEALAAAAAGDAEAQAAVDGAADAEALAAAAAGDAEAQAAVGGAADAEALAAAAAGAAAARGDRRLVVLVDGRSGTGKTTLGNAIADRLRAQIVHLDDVYPGWDGLHAAAEAVVTDVLGTPSGYRRWDWATSVPTDWVTLDPDAPIVIEGCGALSRAAAQLASLRVWLEADDDTRWRRAVGRDGEVFAREWDRWAAQETAFIAAERPATLADVVLRT